MCEDPDAQDDEGGPWWHPQHSPSSDASGSFDLAFHTLPPVSVMFLAAGGRLRLGLSVDASDDPARCEARVLQISLDNVVVARNRGTEPLGHERDMCDLERGRHRVQYVCQFDSGDVAIYERTLVYKGPTRRLAGAPPAHTLGHHGSGLVSPGRPVTWCLDEAHPLPATVVLHGPAHAPLYAQACVTQPGAFQAPRELQCGEARIILSSERYFVVGVHGSGDVPYDLFVESLPDEERRGGGQQQLWVRSVHTPAAYAVCIGISKYTFITPLHWADADAVSWLDYLTARRYAFRLFGDGVSSYTPYTPAALGTESNIRRHMRALAEVVREGDTVAFTDSGHGSGDMRDHSWLCCLDDRDASPVGAYQDHELAVDISLITKKGARVFVFIDACHSFGFANQLQLMCDPEYWFFASTCTAAGVGFDDSSVHHGSFTYAFLVKGLQCRFRDTNPEVGEVFDYARSVYRFRSDPENMPQCRGNRKIRLA